MATFYRRLPKFAYVRPKSLSETLDLLKDNQDGGMRVYAGGTDVIPRLKARLIPTPKLLLDLKGIPLNYLEYERGKGLRIGALTTFSSVIDNGTVQERFGVLFQGSNSVASPQIRNRGTMAGNICSALPSADSPPGLLCLGAKLLCVSSRGERIVDIEDFFLGPRQTALAEDELLKEIRVPDMPEGGRGAYIKLSMRSRMDLAVVGVGVLVAVSDGIFRHVRIGLGSAAPIPVRAKEAEASLVGRKVERKAIAEAGRIAAESSTPRTSHRASAEYRRMMIEVLVKRAILQAIGDQET